MIFQRFGVVVALAATLVLVSAGFEPTSAEAQDTQVNAGIKGTIGLGLVGAEIGFVIPAAAGLEDAWAFVVFPLLGAGGGAVAGYFLLDEGAAAGEGEISVIALAAGMALAVPAMVLTLSLTAYDPGDDGEEAEGADEAEFAEEFEAGSDGETEVEAIEASAVRARRIARSGTGLLRLSEGDVLLGVPGLSVRRTYTAEELTRYGGTQRAELHLPVLSGTF